MSIAANKEMVRRFHTELWLGNLAIVDELLSLHAASAMGDALVLPVYQYHHGQSLRSRDG